MPLVPGFPHVDEPLVLAASEAQLQVALRQHKGPVDEQVHLGQQGVDGGVVFLQQLLVGPAGRASSAKASAWQKGSPPLKVTPFKMGSFWKSANSSWGVVFWPPSKAQVWGLWQPGQ